MSIQDEESLILNTNPDEKEMKWLLRKILRATKERSYSYEDEMVSMTIVVRDDEIPAEFKPLFKRE